MSRLYNLFFIIPLIIIGCKTKEINQDTKIRQSINSLNMNIFSNEGKKYLSIKSPYSSFDKEANVLNLKETTIKLFKNNKGEYIITSEKSKLSNNNKLLELNGNVLVRTIANQEEKLYSNNFIWDINNSEFLLIGKVKFINNLITLSSNKAILNKKDNIIEFFNPVEYKFNDGNNEKRYEIKSENAYYNINTKSVSFRSEKERVRSKIYF